MTQQEQDNQIYSQYRACLEAMGINCTLGCDASEELQHIKSGEENFVVNVLKGQLLQKEKPIIFDVGANEGRYAEFILKHYPLSDFYCFEPHPKTFSRLEKRLDGADVNCRKEALGSKVGVQTLYERNDFPDGSEMASLHKRVITDFHKAKSDEYSVTVNTVDKLVKDLKLERVDFIKIDVEGHELEVLKGAKKTIADNKLKIIQFEFNHPNIASRVFMRDFRDILPDYTFFRLRENNLLPVLDHVIFQEIFGYQNIAAIHNSLF